MRPQDPIVRDPLMKAIHRELAGGGEPTVGGAAVLRIPPHLLTQGARRDELEWV